MIIAFLYVLLYATVAAAIGLTFGIVRETLRLKRKEKVQSIAAPPPVADTQPQVTPQAIKEFLYNQGYLAIPRMQTPEDQSEYDEEGFPIEMRYPHQKHVAYAYANGKTMMTEDPTTKH